MPFEEQRQQMDINFECTMCGKCCHDLKLPLSVDEALVWLERGGDVQFLCEAVPWPDEPPADNLQAQHKRRRSFAASSGELPVRVVVVLAASFEGACPHLQANLSCGVYEKRPTVCRIYPAEINPFIELKPELKECPPEAWTPDKPLLMSGQHVVDAATFELIAKSRAADVSDAPTKARACLLLDIDAAALSNEGLVVHSPPMDLAIAALKRARENDGALEDVMQWKVVSNRRETVDTLTSIGATGVHYVKTDQPAFDYLGFFPASA
jgi:Fe-S-cluster containining protein